MLQSNPLADLFSNPVVIQYIIGGIVLIIVIIVCYSIHNKYIKK